MSNSERDPGKVRRCAQCGAELTGAMPSDLCPKCLLKTGLAAEPASGGGTVAVGRPQIPADFLQPGEPFGHYQIIQSLGGGGMGYVYEAEDLDTGRRVALKVLSHSLDSPEARERFFREGRLAASINHPNSVYIFGTEEVGGTPVISMELLAGGTLQERVRERGPLPAAEAVDAVLQIIAGLEAAHRVGILHRDVKPSNCFVDPGGAVKIGDFGLSISTAIRTEPALTSTGAFLGTPSFCSPEQLRGEELSARSDIYAVGATLYYLLTGRTPFEAQNVVALIATVLERTPPPPSKLQPHIPRGLSRAVLRCLEKQPGDRFKSYDELRRALAPFSSMAPAPARIGRRFLAGCIDGLLITAAVQTVLMIDALDPLEVTTLFHQSPGKAFAMVLAGVFSYVMYFALFEGLLGATPGKALCKVRVVGADNNPPGVGRALIRGCMFVLLPILPIWIAYAGDTRRFITAPQSTQIMFNLLDVAITAALFATARRANGWAAIHDLLTQTHVITRLPFVTRPVPPLPESTASAVESGPNVGPYHVLQKLGAAADGEWLLGYDLRLLRHVWIRTVPPSSPPVPQKLRSLGRTGRLRWLTGRRTLEENWDAFEAPSGQALLARVRSHPQPWATVRFWLQDLAAELETALKDGTSPEALTLDRVWLTDDGRAKILDYAPPGVNTSGSGADAAGTSDSPQVNTPPVTSEKLVPLFLRQVADAALEGSATTPASSSAQPPLARMPLQAREFIQRLPNLPGPAAALDALRLLMHRPAEVSRVRRVGIIMGCLAVPLVFSAFGMVGVQLSKKWQQKNPGIMELNQILSSRMGVRMLQLSKGPTDEQYAVYIAAHYRSVITNVPIWSGPFAMIMVTGKQRAFAEESITKYPAPTAQQIADADKAIGPLAAAAGQTPAAGKLGGILFNGFLVLFVALPALLAAVLFRGGAVLRIAGVAFVRRDGQLASRLRLFWRSFVAWAPAITVLAMWTGVSSAYSVYVQVLGFLVIGALTVISVVLPERGFPDRFAGTWPVPR